MRIASRGIVLGIVIATLWVGKTNAGDVENIVFEAGSVGPTGAPAATGWQLFNTTGVANEAVALIESVPDRTFQSGTPGNKDALVMHPWLNYDPVNGGTGTFRGTVFGHGAEWNTADDLSSAPQTVDPGEIVYLQMEIFSDFAGGGQFWKLGGAVGFKGNADPGFRGFNNEGVLGDNAKQLITSVEADWVYGGNDGFDYNGQIKGSDRAERQNVTRYLNPPTKDELDKTYISTAIFRQGVDAATAFVGTETEIREDLDSKNGGESGATGGSVVTNTEWGGNENVITGMTLDRAQVNVLRGSDNVTSISRVDASSNFIDTAVTDPNDPLHIKNAVLGIRMFRFGTTSKTDVNLDGVTNAEDLAIVTANQGFVDPLTGQGATFFDGDIDNDLDVDAADLAFFVLNGDYNNNGVVDAADYVVWRNGDSPDDSQSGYDLWRANFGNPPGAGSGTALAAVPEPAGAVLLATALLSFAIAKRRRAS